MIWLAVTVASSSHYAALLQRRRGSGATRISGRVSDVVVTFVPLRIIAMERSAIVLKHRNSCNCSCTQYCCCIGVTPFGFSTRIIVASLVAVGSRWPPKTRVVVLTDAEVTRRHGGGGGGKPRRCAARWQRRGGRVWWWGRRCRVGGGKRWREWWRRCGGG